MLSFVRRVAGWVVTLGLLTLLAVTLVVPRLAGATTYTVLTGSMQPTLDPGSLVVVRPADPDEIGVGTVLTYQLESGRPDVVTHRVVAQGLDQDGSPVFQTRGDANEAPDPEWVRPVQVKGETWYALPYLGHVGNLLTGRERRVVIDGLVAVLLGYALVMFATGWRERRRQPGTRVRSAHVQAS